MNQPKVGLIILAAGASTRMKTPKQLLHYRGRSLIRHATSVALASVCRPIAVVLGAYAQKIEPELEHLGVQVIENSQWYEGISTSIYSAIQALVETNPNLNAVAIALGDQPLVSAPIINKIVRFYHLTGQAIITSGYAETVGLSALFDRALFEELLSLEGDAGAKQVIKKHTDRVFKISVPEGVIDIDTPADYKQLQTLNSEFRLSAILQK